MKINNITEFFSVSDQITVDDLDQLSQVGIKSIICNRPDKESEGQVLFKALEEKAQEMEIDIHYLPVVHDTINAKDVADFDRAFNASVKPIHAYCRSGLRAITLWGLMEIKGGNTVDHISKIAGAADFDFSKFPNKFEVLIRTLQSTEAVAINNHEHSYPIVIVGGGAAGISLASSLLQRDHELEIAIIDPAEHHYYQPGFTMVGGGVFNIHQTKRLMNDVMPKRVSWIKAAVHEFNPEKNYLSLDSGATVAYERLVVCPGLTLNLNGIEGLADTLGKNGVTSNYLPEFAPYTWELIQSLKSGKAIFTQPGMPIKCAGAPQKALYLAGDYWYQQNELSNINIEFYNAGGVLFGVKEYVPALESYIAKYQAKLCLNHNLTKIDGAAKKAWFTHIDSEGVSQTVETHFDMIHVCPPQVAPEFIRNSSLVDEAGWVDVDETTLQHKKYNNIWALGDVANSPNAKTAAAVRKQAPVVANNLIADIDNNPPQSAYDGYGSCPLTVEKGKIVLAEFCYGGKLSPTFPKFLLDGTQPSKLAWFLKKTIMPTLYWQGMLKGRELLVGTKDIQKEKLE